VCDCALNVGGTNIVVILYLKMS